MCAFATLQEWCNFVGRKCPWQSQRERVGGGKGALLVFTVDQNRGSLAHTKQLLVR